MSFTLLGGCTPKYHDISDIQESDILGVWLTRYSSCIVDEKDIGEPISHVSHYSGYETLTFFRNGEYVQAFELRENGEWRSLVISNEKWVLDDHAIVHLKNGAWPAAGFERARDFEQVVSFFREIEHDQDSEGPIPLEMGSVRMTEKDILLSADIRNGKVELQHAISPYFFDRDSGPCGIFSKIKGTPTE